MLYNHVIKNVEYYIIFLSVYLKLFKYINMNFLEMVYEYMEHLYQAGLFCMYRYSEEY